MTPVTIERDGLTARELTHGISDFGRAMAVSVAVGSPVLGLIEETIPTKVAGIIVGAMTAVAYLYVELAHTREVNRLMLMDNDRGA